MAQDMETFAARLATFDLVLHPETRRTSSTSKAATPISWPYTRPSPAELAHAGFFYNPYETNPDNTTCFLCRRALDGWEEDDNPITEHLKHSRDCGWAVMMDIQQHSSNPAEIEDPTSDRIAQARQATFGESWPHDGKRGWVCQSDKMVQGGWYFCPNEESVDLASCAYCKLSLDGWEPKDDPFDEHYRRSADCSFFVFAKPSAAATKGRVSRSKKGRTSKTSSRLSTQSTASEVNASDIENSMDQSLISQSAKTKPTKKTSKSKSKGSKSKKDGAAETESLMDLDEVEFSQLEPAKPKRATRGKKRSSAETDRDTISITDGEFIEQPEPPVKKRATKSRTSSQQVQPSVPSEPKIETPEGLGATPEDDDQKTSRAVTKKKASGRGRKASGASSSSSTSKSTSKSHILRDSELDAAIEAGLETDEPESKAIGEEEGEKAAPKPTAKKSKSKKKTTKKDLEPAADTIIHTEETEAQTTRDHESNRIILDVDQLPTKLKNSSKEEKPDKRSSGPSNAKPKEQPTEEYDYQHHDSFVSVEIVSRPPEQHSDMDQNDKDGKKKLKKKTSSEKTKKSKKANKKSDEPQQEARNSPQEQKSRPAPVDTPQRSSQDLLDESLDQKSARRRSSKVPPKTAERYSDIPQEKQLAKSLVESREFNIDESPVASRTENEIQRHGTISPLPSMSKGTPSLSPQSSDAENRPPSLKPSASRALQSSPSKQQSFRIPLAVVTPSPSKRNVQPGRLNTSHPWAPIEIDEVLLAGASDKENVNLHAALSNVKGDLTTPEKKMTVEEWILWNAKNGEERLKRECERLVGQFEREGARAMRALEGIECID